MFDADNEKQHFNKLAREYGGHWWGNRTKTGQYRQEVRAELLTKEIPDTAQIKILEIGCASGDFTFKLAERLIKKAGNINIMAADISDGLIKIARERNRFGNVSFKECDVLNMPFFDGEFDLVCGNAILHHLNLDAALGEVRRVLKDGGRIVFFEPNLLNPEVLLEKKVKFIGRLTQNSPDEIAFSGKFIKNKLKNTGFKNIKITHFDFYHPLIPFFFVQKFNFVFRILEKLPLLKNLSGSLFIYGEK